MTDRYWEAIGVPEELMDWVNKNVVSALKECWEEDPPTGWVDVEDGKMVLTVAGPGKPTKEDPSGEIDVYTVKFDLLVELVEYANPYDDTGGPRSEAQREDMRERSIELQKLADEIAALASMAMESAGSK